MPNKEKRQSTCQRCAIALPAYKSPLVWNRRRYYDVLVGEFIRSLVRFKSPYVYPEADLLGKPRKPALPSQQREKTLLDLHYPVLDELLHVIQFQNIVSGIGHVRFRIPGLFNKFIDQHKTFFFL